MRVLEVGCGEGHQAIYLANKGMIVHAVDSSQKAIKYAIENAKTSRADVEFEVKGHHELDRMKGKFDFIFDWRFLQEITDEDMRERFFISINRLLGPKGKYLSVEFSGDSDFMGNGKLRTSSVGIKIYFATLEESKRIFGKYFRIIEARHITLPQKPNMNILANYMLCERI
ncbi:class I SAM-dependent methyltransferase [Candidatus Pacearchaeota archaeon]|nr:class I SAM-dependent methyltransferase [Candidatus Pacearchaeota archaeon]